MRQRKAILKALGWVQNRKKRWTHPALPGRQLTLLGALRRCGASFTHVNHKQAGPTTTKPDKLAVRVKLHHLTDHLSLRQLKTRNVT
jgi:hypothetical protein